MQAQCVVAPELLIDTDDARGVFRVLADGLCELGYLGLGREQDDALLDRIPVRLRPRLVDKDDLVCALELSQVRPKRRLRVLSRVARADVVEEDRKNTR